MTTALPTAPSAFGLNGPSVAVAVDNATTQGSACFGGENVQTNGASSVLHSGRDWAARCKDRNETTDDIAGDVRTFLASMSFPESSRLVIVDS
ncbi:MAG: hypothetical protein WAS49_16740 [Candidatus Dechloromonas phosphoritropha]